MDEPTHLLAASGDRATMCGIGVRERAALPFMVAGYLARYEAFARARGEHIAICPACHERAEEVGIDDAAP